ncbi:MAG: hypothetical protein JWO86_8704 [Myxococcaceae bacterium]|jgi:hypothetical protein|nr:hypothetical protein [Myxococcaceae bacterium]
MSLIARSTSAALVVAAVLVSASAGAQEAPATAAAAATSTEVASTAPKAECVGQLDRAQSLQTARKLREARTSYVSCSAVACPELVREDCSKSLVELDATIPTVVFSARADGHDVTDARVLLDGEAVASALDGHAVALDPGTHLVRFERSGGGVSEVRLVAREGEKNRAVSAAFVSSTPAEKPKVESGRFPVLPVVLGGTGLLALGGSFYVRLNADSQADHLRNTCAPSCDQSSRDALSDKLVVANVALGVGIGFLALAAADWLFDPRH